MKMSLQVLAVFFSLGVVAVAQNPPATTPRSDTPPSASTTPPATIADPLTPAEQDFVKLLTGAVLVGKFSMELQPDAIPRTERYQIDAVRKVKDDQWIIQSRMKVSNVELPVPVPVQVEWAGDTPMLQLTDLTIPLVGEGFTARILFYGNRYAGTWQHGKIGGHMWGMIESQAQASPKQIPPEQSSSKQPLPNPDIPVENDGAQ